MQLPEYTDGILHLYKVKNDLSCDYPQEVLEDTGLDIWYREISVFDKLRYEFDQGGKEITMKIRIPRYKGVDSTCICVIEDRQHLVFNAAHVLDKDGFPETELTLTKPEREMEL